MEINYESLKTYCTTILPFTKEELELIDTYFEEKSISKNDMLLEDGKICNFIAFVSNGIIRHFHIKNGIEKTCDISFENTWVTDFGSFTQNTPCIINLQALENTTVFLIKKENLYALYEECNKYETFSRLITEQLVQRTTQIAMSLSSDKPQERFEKLIETQPNLFQRVQQKYIANLLGISPESLSRIRNRIFKNLKS